jgi:MFS family permease
MVSAALLEIPTGILSDLVGRRKTIIFGALAAATYAILYAIGGSFWMLALGALFEGLSRSFYSGNNDALLHDTLTASGEIENFDEYLGKTDSMFQIALAISGIIGSLIAQWSFPIIMWLSVIPQLLCVYLGIQIIEPTVNSQQSGNVYSHLKEALMGFITNKKLRLLSISSIVSFGIGEATYQFQSAFYNTLLPVWLIGFVKTLSNIGASFSFHFSGRLIKKYSAINLLLFTTIYNRVVNGLAVLFPGIASPFLMASSSLWHGVQSVSKTTLLQHEFKPHQRATMGSLNAFGGSLFFGIVATSLGFLADVFTPGQAILFFQIAALPVVFLYWKLFRDNA